MIDLYCERLSDGYFAEPVNALSNIAFLIAAFYAWRYSKKHSVRDLGTSLLIVLMVAIGIGSLSFHTFANKISQFADLAPIFIFQLLYLWLYAKTVWGFRWPLRLVLSLALLVCIFISSGFEQYLNGSVLYAPTLTVLFIISSYHTIKSKTGFSLATWSLIVFSLSLIFRTLDNDLCQTIRTGSHFLWHLLNGLVIYLMFKLLVINKAGMET